MKKKKSSGGGANWMDTYGDMVTLLLCFFVLLYSMSTIDEAKWKMIIQSFNKNAVISEENEPTGPSGEESMEGGADLPMTQDEVEYAMDELFKYLAEYVQSNDYESSVSITQGDGYVFISFNDSIFFDGDSYVLRQQGKDALNGIIPALSNAGPYIDELRVLGHTAQATANEPNNPTVDRFLAANRSTVVLLYLQENIDQNQLDPARLVGVQYGQWRPIASNDDRETRRQNRRVELIITGRNLQDELSDSIKQYYTMSEHENPSTEESAPSTSELAEVAPGITVTSGNVTPETPGDVSGRVTSEAPSTQE